MRKIRTALISVILLMTTACNAAKETTGSIAFTAKDNSETPTT